MPRTGDLHNRSSFSPSWRPEVRGRGVVGVGLCFGLSSALADSHLPRGSPHDRQSASSGVSVLARTLIPPGGPTLMISSNPNVLAKALSPKSHRTPQASVYEYGGRAHKHSVHNVSLLRTSPLSHQSPKRPRKLADTRLPRLFGEQPPIGHSCMYVK